MVGWLAGGLIDYSFLFGTCTDRSSAIALLDAADRVEEVPVRELD